MPPEALATTDLVRTEALVEAAAAALPSDAELIPKAEKVVRVDLQALVEIQQT